MIALDIGPFDERGRLLHDEDPAAQLCLCVEVLDARVRTLGVRLHELTVLAVPAACEGLLELVAEGLDAACAHLTLVEVDRFDVPGMLVGLRATTEKEPEMPSLPAETNLSAESKLRLTAVCDVYFPGDPEFDAGRTPWNLAVVQYPAAVAVPRSAGEVAAVVAEAVPLGLRVAPQSTGHGAAALGDQNLDDVVLLRLNEFTGVEIDSANRTARVAGGTLWRDVVAASAPHGLTALHGSAGDVAVAGYVLGGGLSFYGRRHGLGASSVRALDIVTATGELVRASAAENAELFWAVRGGGGNFGVVVGLEIALFPIADVFAGMMMWDLSRAEEVVSAWTAWTNEVPDTVTTACRLMRFPEMPELPPFLSGRSLVVIDGAILENDDVATGLLEPLRALTPEIDTFARIPVTAMLEVHMDPPEPAPAVGDHALLDALDAQAIATLLEIAGPGVDTPLMFAELRHLGGALAVPAPTGGAVDHLPGAYALLAVSPAPTPKMAEIGRAVTAGVVEAMRPWANRRSFLNFADRTVDVATAYGDDAWPRLQQVRATVDPNGVFVANHTMRQAAPSPR